MLTTYRRILAVPGCPALQRHRPGRSPAHLHGGAGHRAAGGGGDRQLRVRRRGGGRHHGRQRRGHAGPGPLHRPARTGPVAAAADPGLGRLARPAGHRGARRLAALERLRVRGARGALPAPGRHVHPGALVLRAGRPAPGADRLRAGVRRGRGGVHHRPDPGHGPGHGVGPGGRPRGRGAGRRRRHPLPRRPARHGAARPPGRARGRGPAADAVAHGRPDRRGVARPRVALRLRRGDDRRVRGGGGPRRHHRSAAGLLGVGQPARRPGDRRDPVATGHGVPAQGRHGRAGPQHGARWASSSPSG